jgi:NAD+ kinase
MKIVIFGNTFKKDTVAEVARILEFMRCNGVEVLLSQELRNEMNLRDSYAPFTDELTDTVDFALSVGGDGTVLNTVAQVLEHNIPVLGINCGHLGFLAEAQAKDVERICRQLVSNDYTIEQRSMLRVSTNDGWQMGSPFALNEIAVMKQELSSMIAVEMHINGELLHTYHADGVLISTPTGSTAYNLSVGGPLVAPQAKVMIISPIATHSLNVRPLVIPDDCFIDMKISSRSHSYLISIDGRSQTFREEVTLHIEKAANTVKLVQLGEHSFFDTLKDKLSWGS